MKIKVFEVNPLGQNTYVVSHAGEAMLIDCGALFEGEEMAIAQYIKEQGVLLKHLVLTHAHFDHACGVPFAWHVFDVAPQLSADDLWLYNTMSGQVKRFLGAEIDFDMPVPAGYLTEGDTLTIGDIEFKVLTIPGHTPGGLSLYCSTEGCVFTGDSLFCGSIGRTDFEQGNLEALLHALKNKILTLPDETVVWPGHGPSSTIGNEKRYNPYF